MKKQVNRFSPNKDISLRKTTAKLFGLLGHILCEYRCRKKKLLIFCNPRKRIVCSKKGQFMSQQSENELLFNISEWFLIKSNCF